MSIKEKGHYIPSKWEWLEKECRDRKFDASAKAAGKMEEMLKAFYGETRTPAWDIEYEAIACGERVIDVDYMVEVAETILFCIACVKAHLKCSWCILSDHNQLCMKNGSLFSLFMTALKMEHSKNIVIKEAKT